MLSIKKININIIILILLGLTLRVILFNLYTKHNNYKIPIDSNQYNEIASKLAEKGNFLNADNTPNFFRLPGYPIFMAVIYKIFGKNQTTMLFIQIIISLLIIYLAFILSNQIFHNTLTSKITALIFTIHPGIILFSGLQASESIFIIFLLLFLIFLFNGINKNKIFYFIFSGIFIGIAGLTRNVGEYLFLGSIFAILLLSKEKLLLKIKHIITIFLPYFSIISIWFIRNYILTGFIFLHTLTGQHFLRYNAVHILMDINNCTWESPHQELFKNRNNTIKKLEQKTHRVLTEIEQDRIALKLAYNIINQNKLIALKDAIKQIFITCFTPYSFMFLNLPPGILFNQHTSTITKIKYYLTNTIKYPIIIPFIILDILIDLILLIGFLFFIINAIKHKNLFNISIVLLFFTLILISITLSYGCARLRIPAEVFIILIASFGLAKFLYKFEKINDKRINL
ncbi:MAG: hypothetical protein SZ59_C0002G0306 [candidate division TM6 bacterium GW2011_GWF2_28_16]|nr:MAG: hypothetical protein SZ59_C0002G0306 [candidate division TM6 bacterium GW2011_GWF2_28_16]